MSISDFFLFLGSPGVVTSIVAILVILGSIWWLVQCSHYLGDMYMTYKEEMARERRTPDILIQATPGMTASQLATLIRDTEALLEQERVA